MKKNITKLYTALAFLLFSISAYAQQGRVGINTTNPKTTLDVSGKTDTSGNILTTDTTGFQAPRLTREELTNKGNSLYGTDQKGAIVYITDISGGDATSQRVNVTSTGYYYFDGILWQKINATNDAIWERQNTNNDVALLFPNGKDDIRYTDKGFKVLDKQSTDMDVINSGVVTSQDYKTTGNYNSYNSSFLNSKNITIADTSNNNITFTNNFLKVNNEETRAAKTITNSENKIEVQQNSTTVISNLRGVTGSTTNFGSGNVTAFQVGVNGSSTSFSSGNISSIMGVSGQASGQGSGTIGILAGVRAQSNISSLQTGAITRMSGIDNSINLGGGSANITNLVAIQSSHTINSAYTGTITNSYDLLIPAYSNNNATITNKYGVFVAGADKRNYFQGNLGINTTTPSAKLHVVKLASELTPAIIAGCNEYTDNAAAVTAGLPIGGLYRTADGTLKVVF